MLKKLIIIFWLSMLLFCIYVYKLYSLSIEGNELYGLRCSDVNSHMINFKNNYLSTWDAVKNPDKYSQEEVVSFVEDYIANIKKYIEAEDKWLEIQKRFTGRWDFKLFSPKYLQQLLKYQYNLFEANLNNYKAFSACINDPDNDGLMSKLLEMKEKIRLSEEQYYKYYDYASSVYDWRKRFYKVYTSDKCNESNSVIPDTSGVLEQLFTPSPLPINPYLEGISG